MTELSALHFLRPGWLALLPLALLFWFLQRRQHRIDAQWRGLIAPHLLAHLIVRPARSFAPAPRDWLLALLLLGSVVLAGPSWQREPSPFSDDSGRLVIVLDLAPTMLGPDIAPTRLARAKLKLRDLLALRRDSRIALVAFAGSAHVVLPFTDDVSAIERTLEVLEPRLMPATSPQTESARMNAALRQAQALLQRDHDGHENNQDSHGTGTGSVLLVSDLQHAAGTALTGNTLPLRPVLWQIARDRNATPEWADDHIVMSTDSRDVEAVHQSLGRQLRQAEEASAQSRRWQDGGIWLLPVLVLLALPGARRGWSARG